MSDNKQQVHTIHFGPKLAEASAIERSFAISALLQDWGHYHLGKPEYKEHKGAEAGQPVLTVKGALGGELLAASLRGFSHQKVEDRPVVATAPSAVQPAPAPTT